MEAVTYKDFLAKLRKTPRQWRITSLGQIRCASDACPMGALFPGVRLPLPEDVADEGDLSLGVALRIARAADGVILGSQTRRDLLKACGLKEKP